MSKPVIRMNAYNPDGSNAHPIHQAQRQLAGQQQPQRPQAQQNAYSGMASGIGNDLVGRFNPQMPPRNDGGAPPPPGYAPGPSQAPWAPNGVQWNGGSSGMDEGFGRAGMGMDQMDPGFSSGNGGRPFPPSPANGNTGVAGPNQFVPYPLQMGGGSAQGIAGQIANAYQPQPSRNMGPAPVPNGGGFLNPPPRPSQGQMQRVSPGMYRDSSGRLVRR